MNRSEHVKIPGIGDGVANTNFITLGSKGPRTINSDEVFNKQRILVIGVVGAFTPVCTSTHLPEFAEFQKELLAEDLVDDVICLSVADPYVMKYWSEYLELGSGITMMTDNNAEFAKAMGLAIDMSKLGMGLRSTRYVMFVKDGIIEMLNIELNPANVIKTSVQTVKKVLFNH